MTLSARMRERLISAALIVAIFAVWELACLVFHVSAIVLPHPSQILVTRVVQMPALWPHILQTLATTMAGFAVVERRVCGWAIRSPAQNYATPGT